MKISITYFLLLIFQPFLSQVELNDSEIKQKFNLISKFYQKDYQLELRYKSYIGHSSTIIEDEQKGIQVKKGDNYVSSLLGRYIVENKSIKVIIDSADNNVSLYYPDSINKILLFDEQKYNISKKRLDKTTLEQRRSFELISFYFKPGYEFDKVTILLSTSGMVKEVGLFFSEYTPYEDENGQMQKDKAKVIISFNEFKSSLPIYKPEQVISLKNKIHLLENFKKFELIDYRYLIK